MLISADNSALLVIDVQEKLLGGIHESENLIKNCQWLMEAAQLMEVPIVGSEQYPQGVGPTTEALKNLLPEGEFIGKTVFSCADSEPCLNAIQALDRKSVVICGMESHVCVMQTALGLKEKGFDVSVVADAISARNPLDTEYAIERMRAEGIRIVTREMVGFEWVRRSDMPQFKTFSMNFLR